jgi:hypothetical protein
MKWTIRVHFGELTCPNNCSYCYRLFLSTFSYVFYPRPESATFFARHNGSDITLVRIFQRTDNKIMSFVVITESYLRFSYALLPRRESATFFARHNGNNKFENDRTKTRECRFQPVHLESTFQVPTCCFVSVVCMHTFGVTLTLLQANV